MNTKKIAIIGLGLIGGSLAKALSQRSGILDITAVNQTEQPLEQALEEGMITRGFTQLNEYVFNADIIFLCTPVKAACEYLADLSGKVRSDCIVTDVGSTKSEIIKTAEIANVSFRFIGGHPMAGSEKSGYTASVEHLFENAYYILCPSCTSGDAALAEITNLVSSIGALPVVMDAGSHDAITGAISHLPHILAAALVNLVSEKDKEGSLRMLAAGGFKDITRIASSDPKMWENIVLSNNIPVSNLIDEYVNSLNRFKAFMETHKAEEVYQFFKSARDYRSTFPSGRKGLIEPLYDIVADIVDRPGIIGEIATVLGNHGLNIKNLNVSNSREFEEGCLIISLPDRESAEEAYKLLNSKGYKTYKKGG